MTDTAKTRKAAARSGNPARRAAAVDDDERLLDADELEDAERAAQALFEDIETPAEITFYDRSFRLKLRIPRMPVLKFAKLATAGASSDDAEGVAAMYDLLRACLNEGHPACGTCDVCAGDLTADTPRPPRPDRCPDYDPSDWAAFEQYATDVGADDEDLWEFVSKALAASAARPTKRRSGSSEPARTSMQNSPAASHSPQAVGLVPVAKLLAAS
jgi:hypothetical protein